MEGGIVPKTDTKILKNCIGGVLSAIDKEYIASCHDTSEGGIGVSLSEMAIGGDIGVNVDLSKIGNNLRSDFKIFSESNARWIIEVKNEKQKDFEKILQKNNTPFEKLGQTTGDNLIIKEKEKDLINQKVYLLREKWKNAIWEIMG
jgi:phosphoribosylformylglycinamidine synthase